MTRHSLLFAATLVSTLGCASTGPQPLDKLKLVFEDTFDGAAGTLPNAASWRFDQGTDWGNGQLEYDTNRPSNVSLNGSGQLAITARQEAFQGRNYTSGRITTKDLVETQYGRIEARIKIPTARGMWPAFWMLGNEFPEMAWPQVGEIDIMENFGREPASIQGALHAPGYFGGNSIYRKYTLPSGTFSDDYHNFAVEWTADRLTYYVDGTLYQSIERTQVPGDAWPFTKPFYLILNLAVGGGPPGPPDGTTFPQVMLVDWVRVYRP